MHADIVGIAPDPAAQRGAGERKADGRLQLLPRQQMTVERRFKMRGEIALGEPFEQNLSVQRQLPAMCRHIPIEKISFFDQDCAK